ncbi:MAG: response regulator [Anaerolineales bacterium]|nr:response regulator [Anaerolineales bacterium]
MADDPFVVLVVDDDTSFCTIMREFLKADGFKVHLAYDVPHALSLLERITPDLILADIMMPDIDGLCLIRNLRSKPAWEHIPTIVVSARTMPEERAAAKEAGADAFVPKPFSFKDLRTTINAFLPCGAG